MLHRNSVEYQNLEVMLYGLLGHNDCLVLGSTQDIGFLRS